MFKKIKSKIGIVGFALAETVVAVGVLATASVSAFSIINDTERLLAMSDNYLITENLLTEAKEVVKVIYMSNWMLNPDNSVYWLCRKPATKCAGSDTVTSPANYIIKQDTSNKWYLEQVPAGTADLNLEANRGNGSTGKNNYGIVLTNGKYISSSTGQPLYYRSIKFLTKDDSKAEFLVKMQWYEGAKIRSIEKSFTISNYPH